MFNTQKKRFSISFSYKNSSIVAIKIDINYYLAADGQWLNFIELIELHNYFIMGKASDKLKYDIEELTNSFMNRFSKSEVRESNKQFYM
jgi:uncharacterized membrane protein